MRKLVVVVLLLLAVFTFINAYSVDRTTQDRTVSAPTTARAN